jgi:hypothetical protein
MASAFWWSGHGVSNIWRSVWLPGFEKALQGFEEQPMVLKTATALILALTTIGGVGGFCVATPGAVTAGSAQENQPAQSAGTRLIGAVKAIAGNSVTLAPDSGSDITVLVQDSTRMLRTAPGQTSLKDATPIKLQDLQVGDRILVRGQASADAKSLVASAIVVMKRSDIEQKQQAERADWQKHGVGGLVSAVDVGSGTITISTMALGTVNKLAVHTSKDTVIRRYAPESVKFDDAKPGTLDQIKPGDQLRARGSRSADSSEFTAEEVVFGSFRNIAGTVSSVDASQSTVNVMDAITKKPVSVKVGADSQIRKLPPMMAQRIAMRLKGEAGASPSGAGAGGSASSASQPGGGAPPGDAGGSRPGGGPDFQQMLNRLPAATLADLQKGDAVMIVATEGTATGRMTVITLLSGVEPILTSSSSATQAALLSSWTLGAPSGEAAQ